MFNQREKKTTKKLGFFTNYATKTQLIESFKVLLQAHFPKLDEETVSELSKFVYTDEASRQGAGAQTGYRDDQVMASLLAFWGVQPKTLRENTIWDRLNRQKSKKVIKYTYN